MLLYFLVTEVSFVYLCVGK